jgi:hypothetical protein
MIDQKLKKKNIRSQTTDYKHTYVSEIQGMRPLLRLPSSPASDRDATPPTSSSPHPSLSPPPRRRRRAPPGDPAGRIRPAAAGLPLPARGSGGPSSTRSPGGSGRADSAGSGAARVLPPLRRGGPWVMQPESRMAWKTTSSSTPGRRPPPQAAQGRARSGPRRAGRACSGLDRTWLARRPLEVLSKLWLSCSAAAVRPAMGVWARSGSGGPKSGGAL